MAEMLQSTYQNKRVFITGHTGFKGGWLVYILNHLGAEVKGYALEPRERSFYNLLKMNNFGESIIADIREQKKLETEITKFKPDYIFHMAAQPLVLASYNDPLETYSTNVMGTANLLNAVRKLDNPCNIVIITTDKVYENFEADYHYKENDRLGGYDPYSNSKACTELVSSSFRNSFFNPSKFKAHGKCIATARSGNVIGGGDWSEDRIVPDLMRALENDERLWIRNPQSVRPWQHLLDPLCGYLLLGAKMNEDPITFAEAYNFGPEEDDTLTVKELVTKAIKIWGQGDFDIEKENNSPHEAGLLKLSIEKAKQELGWFPRLNSVETLEWTVEWYKMANSDAAGITFKQVSDYIKMVS